MDDLQTSDAVSSYGHCHICYIFHNTYNISHVFLFFFDLIFEQLTFIPEQIEPLVQEVRVYVYVEW